MLHTLQGVYLADVSSKSAQYCAAGMSGGTGLLLLCEAELGKPMYEIPTGDSSAQEKAKQLGAIATLGVGRTAPQGWTDGGFIREDLKGVTFPDVTKGLGENKAAKATGYLMFNEYDLLPSKYPVVFFADSQLGTLPTTLHSCD